MISMLEVQRCSFEINIFLSQTIESSQGRFFKIREPCNTLIIELFAYI